MVFTNGWGGSTQNERKIRRRRQWSSPWTIIEEDRLVLQSGNLLDGGAWAATFAINISHVIAYREGALRMSPEDGGLDSIEIANRSGTRDVSHI